ncbi:MAG: hypothetical protein OHK0029_40070 [Armatimonadaceae bacterium]
MGDLLLIQNALRDAVRPRRLLIALLLIALPPLLGIIWKAFAQGEDILPGDIYDSIAFGLVFLFTMPILAVIYGTGIVSQEMEGRTILYLLTRPFPRWRILLAKFLVCVLVVFVISGLSVLLLAFTVFNPARLAEAGVFQDLRALAVGAFTYSALFLLIGTALPKPLTYGLLFVFGWETWVPRLPGQFVRASIMTYLRVLSSRDIFEENTTPENNLLLFLSAPPQVDIPATQAWAILITVSLVCLAGALAVFSTREYAPREDSE